MLFIVLFSVHVVTTFSNFQATFLLISTKVFGIFTPNVTTKVRKICLNFWYQNHSGFEKFGDDVVDHVRHFLIIMKAKCSQWFLEFLLSKTYNATGIL